MFIQYSKKSTKYTNSDTHSGKVNKNNKLVSKIMIYQFKISTEATKMRRTRSELSGFRVC